MKGEVKLLKLSKPTSLTAVELLWLLEVLEVGVISEDFKGMFCQYQVLAEFLQCNHDSQEFMVINGIIPLSLREGFGEESDRSPYTIDFLRKYSTNSIFQSISLQTEWVVI